MGGRGATETGVYIEPARQQLIGVRTATVTRRQLDTTIRTVGTLAYDETRVTEIHPKISGWVEQVFVDFVGKRVSRGQPLFTIYSPDLVSTQKEYLLALKAQQQLGQSRFPETRAGAESLVAAARERLALWDISEKQIQELERTGQPRRTLTLYSPFNGVVLERNTFAGQYISPETSTFKIADLSTIWVLGQIFEYETRLVKLGQEAEIQFPYEQSTRSLKGRITFIYPEVDPQTRRVKVRIEFRNPGFEFKPESYVTVLIRVDGRRTARPSQRSRDRQRRETLRHRGAAERLLRAARDRSRPARGRLLPPGQRAGRGRPGRDLGAVPHRFRDQPAGGDAGDGDEHAGHGHGRRQIQTGRDEAIRTTARSEGAGSLPAQVSG